MQPADWVSPVQKPVQASGEMNADAVLSCIRTGKSPERARKNELTQFPKSARIGNGQAATKTEDAEHADPLSHPMGEGQGEGHGLFAAEMKNTFQHPLIS